SGAEGATPYTSYSQYQPSITTTPTYYETVITVPTGRYWMSIVPCGGASNYVYYDDLTVKKQLGQAFISDLRADQIVANIGQIGLVFADQIRQTDFSPYQSGSLYTGDLGFDFNYASGSSYDLVSDTITTTTSGSSNNTSSVVTRDWQKIKAGSDGYVEAVAPAVLNPDTVFFIGL